MRLTAFATVFATGAGLAAQAGASPIRIVLSSHTNAPSVAGLPEHQGERHILPPHTPFPHFMHKEGGIAPVRAGRGRGCGKSVSISNKFRGFFGLPLIPVEDGQKFHIAVMPQSKNDHMSWINTKTDEGKKMLEELMRNHHGHHHGEQEFKIGTVGEPIIHPDPPHLYHPSHLGPTFLHRLSTALMALGPWEGRAVAFVLGCGLGVLLRMIFVLGVVTVRAIRGSRQSQDEDDVDYYEPIASAEHIILPPPQYTVYSDDKVAVPVEVKEDSERK